MSALSPAAPEGTPAGITPPSRWVLPGLLTIVALFDGCFWDRAGFPGLSLGVFFAVVAFVIRLNRGQGSLDARGRILGLLLAGTLVEAIIETGFCNMLLLLLLVSAFAAETFFLARAPGLDRWSAQLRAFALAPFRLVHLGFTLAERMLFRRGLMGRLAALVVIVLPTLALVVLFSALLSGGNAVFALWTRQAFGWVWTLLPDLSLGRMLLWVMVAVAAVAWLWPSEAPNRSWNGTMRFDRWTDLVPAPLAVTSSAVLLVALNALFAIANGADAVFLWRGGTLPAGVTYSAFVHQGVEILIVTVLLSAMVLATVFNQAVAVAGRLGLKLLGGLWIAQNLFLLLSCARRLELYLEAYGATVQRFSTLLFLLLVAAGFALLAVMMVREKPLAWLVGRSFLASFATLYLAQFLNLAGWVADYNVARWEQDRSRPLDVGYLHELGPAAWPALVRAEGLGATLAWDNDQRHFGRPATIREDEERFPRTRLDGGHWREFGLRAWWNRGALRREADKK